MVLQMFAFVCTLICIVPKKVLLCLITTGELYVFTMGRQNHPKNYYALKGFMFCFFLKSFYQRTLEKTILGFFMTMVFTKHPLKNLCIYITIVLNKDLWKKYFLRVHIMMACNKESLRTSFLKGGMNDVLFFKGCSEPQQIPHTVFHTCTNIG